MGVDGSAAGAAPTLDIGFVERFLAAAPRDGGAWSTLGVLLRREGKVDAAIACHHRGLAHSPDNAGVWSNLGNVLVERGAYAAGIAKHRRACALAPDAVSSWYNLCIGLRKGGRFEEALRALEWTMKLDPANPQVPWERALTLLQTGDYERGLPAYETRRGIAAYRNRVADGPAWDGSPLNGRTILLTTEQGFGDALMAARYIPMVKAKGGRIILESHPELYRVFSRLPIDAILPAGAQFPAYDVQAPLMSLPWLCGTTFDTVPPPVSLHVPEEARAKAARLIGPPDGTLKVGIVWSGRVTFADNARRATSLDRFFRLFEAPGVHFHSLQKGPPEQQLADLGTGALITPLGPHFDDFADTAAAIERLDLVIMTDSSVAHLVGSLGRPIWNLVQFVPYWIYGFEGEGTPWYPSMRLFRQGEDEDWDPVFTRVRDELTRLADERRRSFAGA